MAEEEIRGIEGLESTEPILEGIEKDRTEEPISEIDRYIKERDERRRQEQEEGKSRKRYAHSDIVWNYFYSKDRQHYRVGRRVFFEGDSLYSYGLHFTLAVKTEYGRFIINADKDSISTNGHQSIAISTSPEGTPQIPFSALNRAEINPKHIDIIDKTGDTWEERRVKDKDGNIKTTEIHHLGACLFRHRGTFYLSGLDNGNRRRVWEYFLVELKHGVDTVAEAFREISGLSDSEYEKYERGEILRQGEYFFHPVGSTRDLKKLMRAWGIKPELKPVTGFFFGGIWIRRGNVEKQANLGHIIFHNRPSNNPHVARDYVAIPLLGFFARGTVRHPEHGMMRLQETWHKVTLNNVENSWSAGGGVD